MNDVYLWHHMSLLQSDVSGPERPSAVARIQREGGEGLSGGDKDQRAAQQPGKRSRLHKHHHNHVTLLILSSSYLSANQVEELNWNTKTFIKRSRKFHIHHDGSEEVLQQPPQRTEWMELTFSAESSMNHNLNIPQKCFVNMNVKNRIKYDP